MSMPKLLQRPDGNKTEVGFSAAEMTLRCDRRRALLSERCLVATGLTAMHGLQSFSHFRDDCSARPDLQMVDADDITGFLCGPDHAGLAR